MNPKKFSTYLDHPLIQATAAEQQSRQAPDLITDHEQVMSFLLPLLDS